MWVSFTMVRSHAVVTDQTEMTRIYFSTYTNIFHCLRKYKILPASRPILRFLFPSYGISSSNLHNLTKIWDETATFVYAEK